jgi:hypothetical protein
MVLENSPLPILTHVNQTKALVASEGRDVAVTIDICDNRLITRQERKRGEQMGREA